MPTSPGEDRGAQADTPAKLPGGRGSGQFVPSKVYADRRGLRILVYEVCNADDGAEAVRYHYWDDDEEEWTRALAEDFAWRLYDEGFRLVEP